MEIKGSFGSNGLLDGQPESASGAFYQGDRATSFAAGSSAYYGVKFQASRAWTGTTNTAQPQTVNLGKGTAFSIMPPYLVVNIWKRLS